jgi:hypothetical protein
MVNNFRAKEEGVLLLQNLIQRRIFKKDMFKKPYDLCSPFPHRIAGQVQFWPDMDPAFWLGTGSGSDSGLTI